MPRRTSTSAAPAFFALGLAKATGRAGRPRVHVGHRGRQLRARGDRGVRGARAAARADRRPPAGAARASAPARRSTRSSSTAARPSGSSRSTTTRPRPARVRWLRQLACRAFWTALDGRPGPVHLNFALREPLVPDGPDGVPDVEIVPGREGGRPWVTRPRTRVDATATLLDGLEDELRARLARAGRRRARGARPAAGRGAGRVRRARGSAAAGRPAVGRAARAGGDRALRRAAARRCRGRRRMRRSWCCGSATCRPRSRCATWLAGLTGALQVSFDPERPGRTRPAPWGRSSAPTRARRSPRSRTGCRSAAGTRAGSTAGTRPTARPRARSPPRSAPRG